jgi:hypothetical protein
LTDPNKFGTNINNTLNPKADVAQLAEQLIRNQQVGGSIPLIGSSFNQ